MVNIVNATGQGGGFRAYSGLLPTYPGNGGPQAQASVRMFHVPGANAAAIFRGDMVVLNSAALGNAGAADLPYNVYGVPAVASVVIGNGGGTGLGNPAMVPNVSRWVPGDTTSILAGVVVGFGPITLYQAKNGFQYVPAVTEAWLSVETDPAVEMNITVPTVPAPTFDLQLNNGCDVQANAGQQSLRFGISGSSINPASFANTATLPLRVLNSGWQIGNDTTAAGFVANVQFNLTRHYKGTAGFIAD